MALRDVTFYRSTRCNLNNFFLKSRLLVLKIMDHLPQSQGFYPVKPHGEYLWLNNLTPNRRDLKTAVVKSCCFTFTKTKIAHKECK